jgi:hypothetical protein
MMKKAGLFLLCCALSLSSLAAQQKYALVIGNGAYTGITRLNNPVNDAADISAALRGLGFTVDQLTNANRVQMEEGVTRLKNRLGGARGSYGFFYYAGHGVQSGGENYLIPVDAAIPGEAYLRDRSVSMLAVLDELNGAGNALNIVVLDACRDNPFSWRRGGTRGLQVVSNRPANSIIVYATGAGNTADDNPSGRNGLFTSQLLKHLKTPGLEVNEVFRLTGRDVAQISEGRQRPEVSNSFYEVAYLGTPAAAQPAPVPVPVRPAAQTQRPAPASRPEAAPRVQPPASAEITRVPLTRTQSTALEELGAYLIGRLRANSNVATLVVTSENAGLSASVIDGLNRNLINSGRLLVADESTVNIIRRELDVQLNEEVPDDTSIVFGRLLGVNVIITGSIRNGSGASRHLYVTAIEVDTNRVLAKASYIFN